MEKNLKITEKILNIMIILGVLVMIIVIILHAASWGESIYEQEKYDKEYEERKNKQYQEAIEAYNFNIKDYIKDNIKGSEIKSMIDTIIYQNNEYIDMDMFIGIMIAEGETISEYNIEDQEALKQACKKASGFSTIDGSRVTDGENTKKNVKKSATQMEKLKNIISDQKNYNVKALTNDGFYTWIIISEAD